MAKGKDVQLTVILKCTSCFRNSVDKVSRGISRYITQKNRHEPIYMSLLLLTYDSWGDKEIERTKYLCLTLSRKGKK